MDNPDVQRICQLVDYQAQQIPEAIALVDAQGVELNWSAYQAGVIALSEILAKQGVGESDRVLIVAENCIPAVLCVFAASKLGAVAIPVNARMSKREIAAIQNHCRPKLVVYTSSVSDVAQAHGCLAGAVTAQTLYGNIDIAVPTANVTEQKNESDDLAVILYTTGTTGEPKGVMLSHSNLIFAGRASAGLRSIQSADRVYGALPITHVFGLASVVMASATVGACVQLETRFKPDLLFNALKNDISVLPAVPQMHALLMEYAEHKGLEKLQGGSLRYVSSGAAPLDPAWKRKAESFYGLALQNGYGMTESTAGISATNNAIGSPDISVGTALPGIEIKIDHCTGADASSEGEILTRGPHVMLGYFNNSGDTSKVIDKKGYLRTGDIGRIDEDGLLHICGRCKELIIRSGFNVYPPEVEAAINDHPDVVQCAVIGRKNDAGNEDVLAFVQCVVGTSLDAMALKPFALERLTAYKCPTHFVFVDTLPAAATGKILKHQLLNNFSDLLN
ncbi:acyl--CoA ligase [Granulosicoccus sp.]|nr:class I adenylate-forming enzyme family protein [Granulosicoccus sp.]MDB4223064.1 acyl--CoA ligase [Granulosicoccus sp.]